jgi:hypothetical protein
MQKATKELRSLPEEAFQKCFQQWKKHWAKCGVTRGLLWRGLGIEPRQVRNFFSWPKDRVVVGILTSIFQWVVMGWYLNMHRHNFSLYKIYSRQCTMSIPI